MVELTTLHNTYYILRHGESEANATGVVASGRRAVREYGLTPRGIEQVEESAQNAQNLFDSSTLILTSPMRRARETATVFANIIGVDPQTIYIRRDLRERYFGNYDGQDSKHYKETIWPDDPTHPDERQDGIESTESVRRRMLRVIESMEARYSGKQIVLVGHGDPFQILQTAFFGISSGEHRSLEHIDNAALIQLNNRRAN